jgi:hypothetical protein
MITRVEWLEKPVAHEPARESQPVSSHAKVNSPKSEESITKTWSAISEGSVHFVPANDEDKLQMSLMEAGSLVWLIPSLFS